MTRDRILVVAEDTPERASLSTALWELGYEVREAGRADDALAVLGRFPPDVVMADAGVVDGPLLIAHTRASGSDAAFVVSTVPEQIKPAVAAMLAGAESWVEKPLVPAQVALVLQKALEKRRLRRESGDLRERVRARTQLVGASAEVQLANEMIRTAAPTRASVLVVGEPGTGKQLVARALHEASPRRDRPFVRIGCAALSEVLLESELFGHERGAFAEATRRQEGALERADGGTIFLHEVESLSPSLQVKLLRVLREGEFQRLGGTEALSTDVRVIASAREDLAAAVRAGLFREDLFYRLNVVSVQLPPLRKRKADIPALAIHFIALSGRSEIRGFTPGALSTLFAYEWPGNVRELENVVEAAVHSTRGVQVADADLSPVLRSATPGEQTASALIPGATLFEIEREAILRTLDLVGGSTVRAAEVLGVSVRKIQYRLKEYQTGRLGRRGHPPVAEAWANSRHS